MPHHLLAQLFGSVAVIIALGTYQFNNRRTMLKLNMVAGLFYTVSFALLGAPTGAAMNALTSVRCVVFLRVRPSGKTTWILLTIIAAAVGLTLLSWQGPKSLFAMGGAILSAIAFWQKKPRMIRSLAIIIPPLWFTYDGLVGSYPGMFIEVFNVLSILIGKYRFDFQKLLARPAK